MHTVTIIILLIVCCSLHTDSHGNCLPCTYSKSACPSKPKLASESKLVNWKNVGDEFDEGDFTAT